MKLFHLIFFCPSTFSCLGECCNMPVPEVFHGLWKLYPIESKSRYTKDSPKFSPPQMSMAVSYLPRWLNQDLSITKSPPAMMGVLSKEQETTRREGSRRDRVCVASSSLESNQIQKRKDSSTTCGYFCVFQNSKEHADWQPLKRSHTHSLAHRHNQRLNHDLEQCDERIAEGQHVSSNTLCSSTIILPPPPANSTLCFVCVLLCVGGST